MSKVILIHYNEIGLKGGNRRMFEQQLQNNIQKVLDDLFVDESRSGAQVKWQYGRLYVENFNMADWPKIKERLQKVFGIANFVLAEKVTFQCHPEEALGRRRIFGALAQIRAVLGKKFLSSPTPALPLKKGEGTSRSFRITARRAQKDFPLTSQEINEKLGAFVIEKTGAEVDLKNPDITFYVEIVNKNSFIYVDLRILSSVVIPTKVGIHGVRASKLEGNKRRMDSGTVAGMTEVYPVDDVAGIIQGAGGLPVGVSGKAVCLLSGGIDSPVAAWSAMKRGLEVYFVHFHSAPQTDMASQDKVKRIVKILNQWQALFCHSRAGRTRNPWIPGPACASSLRSSYGKARQARNDNLYENDNLIMISFLEFQKKVLTKTPAKYRVILYRREMMRQAEKIAMQIGAKAILTGEALGQVASQTIENLAVIEQATNLPVLRPLICFDKQEIIKLAQKIGTYEISTEPYQDCCSLFVPEHPATKANLADILKVEKDL